MRILYTLALLFGLIAYSHQTFATTFGARNGTANSTEDELVGNFLSKMILMGEKSMSL